MAVAAVSDDQWNCAICLGIPRHPAKIVEANRSIQHAEAICAECLFIHMLDSPRCPLCRGTIQKVGIDNAKAAQISEYVETLGLAHEYAVHDPLTRDMTYWNWNHISRIFIHSTRDVAGFLGIRDEQIPAGALHPLDYEPTIDTYIVGQAEPLQESRLDNQEENLIEDDSVCDKQSFWSCCCTIFLSFSAGVGIVLAAIGAVFLGIFCWNKR